MTDEQTPPDEQGHAPVIPESGSESEPRHGRHREPKRDGPEGDEKTWTREGPDAPDAADIADPDEQL